MRSEVQSVATIGDAVGRVEDSSVVCDQPSWRVMASSRVRLPRGVRPPYTVFVNGVRQREGVDYRVVDDMLVFEADLAKEGKLGFWRWFWGAWGIGTYRKDDKVDVAWEADGRPHVAHALDIDRQRAKPG